MLLVGQDLVDGRDDAVRRDPEVQQARKIADAARSRLLSCVAGPLEAVDLPETQRIFEMLREAEALVEDEEDRVLAHRGLLTPAEAERRAAARRPAAPSASALPACAGARREEQARRALRFKPGRVPALPTLSPAARRAATSVILHALIPAAAGFAGAAFAKGRR